MTAEEILNHIREGFDHGISPKVIAFVLRNVEADLWNGTVAEKALQTDTVSENTTPRKHLHLRTVGSDEGRSYA